MRRHAGILDTYVAVTAVLDRKGKEYEIADQNADGTFCRCAAGSADDGNVWYYSAC